MRYWFVVLCCFCCLAVTSREASAEKRVALVIGNSDYKFTTRLANPANDAALMAKTLRNLGFEVLERTDLGYRAMKRSLRDYLEKLDLYGRETVGLVYYAGHGLQVGGINYLVPTNAKIERTADVDIEGISASTLLSGMRQAKNRLNIIILDACRNNPYRSLFRDPVRGLARMDAPVGSYVVFSTAPGDVAADGTGRNSPFTKSLAHHLIIPGLKVEDVIKRVGKDVSELTNGRQRPWLSTSVYEDFYPAGRSSAGNDRAERAAREWERIKQSRDVAKLAEYLEKFPTSPFAADARFRIDVLKGHQQNARAASDWEKLESSTEIAKLEGYIAKYPAHAFSKIAAFRIKELKRAKRQREVVAAWERVKDSNRTQALKAFIQEYPKTLFASIAADRIAAIERRAGLAPTPNNVAAQYWAEIRQSSDQRVFEKFIERFPTSPFTALALKRLDDLRAKPTAVRRRPVSPPPVATEEPTQLSLTELTKNLQRQLRRVGCNPGAIDGIWGGLGRAALERYNRHAQQSLDTVSPTLAAVEALQKHSGRVCPVVARAPSAPATSPSRTTSVTTSRPPANSYSRRYWPSYSISTGERRSTSTPYGTLVCIGGSSSSPRRCSWR